MSLVPEVVYGLIFREVENRHNGLAELREPKRSLLASKKVLVGVSWAARRSG